MCIIVIAVCNDQKTIDIIQKIMFKIDVEYTTFLDIKSEFFALTKTATPKIYILDMYSLYGFGLDIAKKIRENDWNSKIIMISSKPEYDRIVCRSNLEIFTFIDKIFEFDEKLESALIKTIEILFQKETILYIEKIKGTKKCLIKTTLREYELTSNLKSLKEKYNLQQISKNRLEGYLSTI